MTEAFIVGIAFGMIFGGILIFALNQSSWLSTMKDRGYAEHRKTDGKLVYKDNGDLVL